MVLVVIAHVPAFGQVAANRAVVDKKLPENNINSAAQAQAAVQGDACIPSNLRVGENHVAAEYGDGGPVNAIPGRHVVGELRVQDTGGTSVREGRAFRAVATPISFVSRERSFGNCERAIV